MHDTTDASTRCLYCGQSHAGVCSRVKLIRYHENGLISEVQLHGQSVDPTVTALRARIAAIDNAFETAENSGSWMGELARERRSLVQQLRLRGVAAEDKYRFIL